MVTLNDGILLEIKEVIILLGMIEVGIVIILFDNRLLMVTLVVHLVGSRVHLVVDKSLPLKEVLTSLLLLH